MLFLVFILSLSNQFDCDCLYIPYKHKRILLESLISILSISRDGRAMVGGMQPWREKAREIVLFISQPLLYPE